MAFSMKGKNFLATSMAEPESQNLQQQALHRHYESPVTPYSSQQHYHTHHNAQYPTYPNQMGMGQYHQSLPPNQWGYFNPNLYFRSPPSYQNYGHYTYQHYSQSSRPIASQQFASIANAQHGVAYANNHLHPQEAPHEIPPTPPLETRPIQSPVPVAAFSGHKAPYYPPLPWLSQPDKTFPPRQARLRRRPRVQSFSKPVELPSRLKKPLDIDEDSDASQSESLQVHQVEKVGMSEAESVNTKLQTSANQSQSQSVLLKDKGDIRESSAVKLSSQGTQKCSAVIPAIPNIPATTKMASSSPVRPDTARILEKGISNDKVDDQKSTSPKTAGEPVEAISKISAKSWAELLKAPSGSLPASKANENTNVSSNSDLFQRRQNLLGYSISSFTMEMTQRISFLEPRGLVNSGNMCYMNSILQALIFCVPFYNFLSHVSRNAVYSFASDTPLLDAMIMFMKEFNVIDSADSPERLRLRLKPMELEQFGDSLLPSYVYEEIRRMPRFATMQRGHQQDAEEFLGFLFEELQGECTRAINASATGKPQDQSKYEPPVAHKEEDGWLEVGPRQRASNTHSSGTVDVDTPINRIFGGQLRSELRIPGAKISITLEPYQSLQLDIGSADVRTIVDALKGLTKPETLFGDFQSPRGTGATATKQVFIEALPPVLILHLKRFQYNNTGGTQKIWKNIGYPLQLEIPKEVFPHSKRGSFVAHGGLPKYRLTSVIYHHGKSATAGHYTTDLQRQDNKEWLRVDDTFIKRVRSHDVEADGEEVARSLTTALEQHRDDSVSTFQPTDNATSNVMDGSPENGWSQARSSGKKWPGAVNETRRSSGFATPTGPQSLKDNKVAYILFYERMQV